MGTRQDKTDLSWGARWARALGLAERKGRLALGLEADLVLWEIDDPAELCYGHGLVTPAAIWRGGQLVV